MSFKPLPNDLPFLGKRLSTETQERGKAVGLSDVRKVRIATPEKVIGTHN